MADTDFKIAFIDIETSPNLGWVWGKWEQNVIEFEREWHILSFSVKWLHERGTNTYALPDYPAAYKVDPENDRKLIQELWKVFDEADIIITHNGLKFDIPKTNARFLEHGLPPPTPYKTIDTLVLARKHFAFSSNKLGDLCVKLGLGGKVKHPGFELWRKCMLGDPKAWKLMKKYNAQDVVLLEKLYLKLRPWHETHPNVALMKGQYHACPACGSLKTQARGWYYIVARRCRRYQCQDCHKWSKGAYEKIPGTLLK